MRRKNEEGPGCAGTQPRPKTEKGHISADVENQNGTGQSRASAHDAALLRFDAIHENAATLQSLAISLGEAAFRSSEPMVGVHLQQMRLTLISTIGLYKEIVGPSADEGGAQ